MRQDFWQYWLDLIYPARSICALCNGRLPRDDQEKVCPVCREQLAGWQKKYKPCERCGRLAEQSGLCRDCQTMLPPFLIARAAGPYQGVVRAAIQGLKYRGRRRLGSTLGELMAWTVQSEPAYHPIQAIISVPLSKARLRERGYNQAEILAVELGRILQVKVVRGALVKVRDTASQVQLDRANRLANLAGAFTVSRTLRHEEGNILLVDDILTTGATAAACSRVLLAAGADRVSVVTAATAMARGQGKWRNDKI